jgi:signal transduction histidine kinase
VQWTLFGYHIKYMMRQVALERESRKARLQARAESRIKDIVISRVNTNVRDRLERLMAYAADAETEMNGTPRKNVLAHSIGAVVDVAEDMSDTLSQIVHFSQALSGSLNLDERRHSLQRLLRQVEASMNGQAARREVSVVIEATQPIEVECDATELCAAVSNLVLNAIQHTPRGGSVVVKTELDEDKALLVRVEDDGPGIAPDMLAGLLSAHATTLPGSGAGGTLGLGLPLAKLIAEAHGGALHVQSAVGRGTTAIIQIPPDRIHLDDAVAA